jgi:ADP-ribosylglycohydrolase
MNLREKIINGLYGCAVADAVGNPFEFQKKINPVDVIKYANDTNKLVISDDTQMTMFGFEAIHNANDYGGVLDEEEIRFLFTDSYDDWYSTQIKYPPSDDPELMFNPRKCLNDFPSMFSVQAPGTTCLSSLYKLRYHAEVVNDSMGCGSVMRLLPLVSLYALDSFGFISPNDVMKFAKISGNITHKHKDNDIAISMYMDCARDILFNNLSRPIRSSSSIHISELGEGWIAPECVNMAIWAYAKANTFDELLALSIAHDGDSDSVAAVAGSLWGLSGREVPQKYIDKLDALDAINFLIKEYIK